MLKQQGITEETAQQIMGKNFFGLESLKLWWPSSSGEEKEMSGIPWTPDFLKERSRSHILVARRPLSVVEIAEMYPNFFRPTFQRLYGDLECMNEKSQFGWQLVRKHPIYTYKTWKDQISLLNLFLPDEEQMSIGPLVYTIISNFLANGEKLFPSISVASTCSDHLENRMCVGHFYFGVLNFQGWYDLDPMDGIGMASAVKQDAEQ